MTCFPDVLVAVHLFVFLQGSKGGGPYRLRKGAGLVQTEKVGRKSLLQHDTLEFEPGSLSQLLDCGPHKLQPIAGFQDAESHSTSSDGGPRSHEHVTKLGQPGLYADDGGLFNSITPFRNGAR